MTNEDRLANVADALTQLANSLDTLTNLLQYDPQSGKNSLIGALNNLASCIGSGMGSSLLNSIETLARNLKKKDD